MSIREHCRQPELQAMGPPIDEAFGNWFAGFVDGEGCFVIRVQRGRHSTAFQLRLREDDIAVLLSIRDHLNLGKIYREWPRRGREGYYSKPKALWWVQTKAGCMRLIDIFDRFPLHSKKVQDYVIWREAVLEYRSSQPNQVRLASLKAELEDGRKYTEPTVEPL